MHRALQFFWDTTGNILFFLLWPSLLILLAWSNPITSIKLDGKKRKPKGTEKPSFKKNSCFFVQFTFSFFVLNDLLADCFGLYWYLQCLSNKSWVHQLHWFRWHRCCVVFFICYVICRFMNLKKDHGWSYLKNNWSAWLSNCCLQSFWIADVAVTKCHQQPDEIRIIFTRTS